MITLIDADKMLRLELIGDDTSELLCAIETSFGIEFTADDIVEATTIEKLSDCVSKKLDCPKYGDCLSLLVFHRLRREFIDVLKVPRVQIVPQSPLKEIFPFRGRRSSWAGLQERLGWTLPGLVWPAWVWATFLLFVIGLCRLIWVWLAVYPSFRFSLLVIGILASILVLRLLCRIRSLACAFPRDCKTIGGLVKLVIAHNYAKIAVECNTTSEREVFQALQHLIATETGTPAEKVASETRFPEGLGIY